MGHVCGHKDTFKFHDILSGALQGKGIFCANDNKHVASQADILFLCILPSQFPLVVEDVKGSIRSTCVVYSFMSTVTIPRLKHLLMHTNIVRPEYEWVNNMSSLGWQFGIGLTEAFSNLSILVQTCPLSSQSDGNN